jgi:hypothetical protein
MRVGGFSQAVFSALEARAYFLLLRQKKVAKEKATLGRRRATPGPLRYSAVAGAAELGLRPQTVLALFPRQPALLGASQGARQTIHGQTGFFNFGHFFGPTVAFLFSDRILSPDAFRVPLRGAEQRRRAGGSRLAVFEPQASLASRPAHRVAQGTGAAGADLGVAFSLATFFWRSKRKYARQQGGNPCQSQPPARQTSMAAQNQTPPKGATP